eukprot:1027411-Prymnesium_polylepis.1
MHSDRWFSAGEWRAAHHQLLGPTSGEYAGEGGLSHTSSSHTGRRDHIPCMQGPARVRLSSERPLVAKHTPHE